ncbi:hypothetical protein GCM10025868_41450 [Angustibacter aerolatus]|uniref:Uncharacterized protein n=1 Tax=Angustibacter aerolatus TaxID=1162965 RepID=A0ABQ6JNQ4_9ACTN|nr:hypothetical protein GCM10025868_41450 [Angustibacter aerolatus]
MLPPSVTWYWTPSASSLSTIALASEPARLLNSGAYVGAVTHLPNATAPSSTPTVSSAAMTRWPAEKPDMVRCAFCSA